MSQALAFSYPWALAALLLLPVYYVLRRRVLSRGAVAYPPLQCRPVPRRDRAAAQLRLPIELLLLAFAVVALAGPHRASRLELIEDEGADVMLVLDISLSMLAEDFPPNRLEALRRIARDFIQRSGSHRVGLVIFGKDVFVQSPLTTDHRVLLELLSSVSVYNIDQVKSGGTAVGDALLVAADRLARVRVEGRGQALVLITDGESNMGADPVLAARYVRHHDLRLYAIGIGGDKPLEVYFEGRRVGGDTPYLAYLDDRQLKAVAEEAEGRYFRATDAAALEEIFAHLSRLESAPVEVRTVEIKRYHTSYLALAILPLYATWLMLGGIVLRRPYR